MLIKKKKVEVSWQFFEKHFIIKEKKINYLLGPKKASFLLKKISKQ